MAASAGFQGLPQRHFRLARAFPEFSRRSMPSEVGLCRAFFSLQSPKLIAVTISQGQSLNQALVMPASEVSSCEDWL